MEFIEKYGHKTNNFTLKIMNNSPYIEGNTKKIVNIGFKDICEIIIGENEIEYNTLEDNHRENYIKTKKLEIASSAIKNDKYSRSFNISTIQGGLQGINNFSSILYLNEYYKINCILFNRDINKYYSTSFKDYPILICSFSNNKWMKETNDPPTDIEYSPDYKELSNIINIDCDKNIYKPHLGSISKYKLHDLENICNGLNIDLKKKNGKKKLKKELYHNINLKHLKEDI